MSLTKCWQLYVHKLFLRGVFILQIGLLQLLKNYIDTRTNYLSSSRQLLLLMSLQALRLLARLLGRKTDLLCLLSVVSGGKFTLIIGNVRGNCGGSGSSSTEVSSRGSTRMGGYSSARSLSESGANISQHHRCWPGGRLYCLGPATLIGGLWLSGRGSGCARG